MGQPLVVPKDDLLEQREFILDLKQFVHLLLILHDGKFSLRILGKVFYLLRREIRIGTH